MNSAFSAAHRRVSWILLNLDWRESPAAKAVSRQFIFILMVFGFIAFFGSEISAFAHPGQTDALGCHRDKRVGDYHCHKGPLKGQHFRSKSEAEKLLGKQAPIQFKSKQFKKESCGSNAGFCTGCGCKGGPGYRSKASGECVGYKQLLAECGNPPSSVRCLFENAPGTGSNRECVLGQ